MKGLLIFTYGVLVGLYIEKYKIYEPLYPFTDTCKIAECGKKVHSSTPEGALFRMKEHRKKVHPGWR